MPVTIDIIIQDLLRGHGELFKSGQTGPSTTFITKNICVLPHMKKDSLELGEVLERTLVIDGEKKELIFPRNYEELVEYIPVYMGASFAIFRSKKDNKKFVHTKEDELGKITLSEFSLTKSIADDIDRYSTRLFDDLFMVSKYDVVTLDPRDIKDVSVRETVEILNKNGEKVYIGLTIVESAVNDPESFEKVIICYTTYSLMTPDGNLMVKPFLIDVNNVPRFFNEGENIRNETACYLTMDKEILSKEALINHGNRQLLLGKIQNRE